MTDRFLVYAVSSQAFILSLPDGELLHVLNGHVGNVTAIAVDGDVVLTGSELGEAFVWDAKSGGLALKLKAGNSSVTAVSLRGTVDSGLAAVATEKIASLEALISDLRAKCKPGACAVDIGCQTSSSAAAS